MRISGSVAVRLVLIGFFATVAWGLHTRASEAVHGVSETLALEALTVALDEVTAVKPER